jgi:putative DNA primase/helicase
MSLDAVDFKQRAAQKAKELLEAAPSEDAMALAFVDRHGAHCRYVAPLHRWIEFDGKRYSEDSTGNVFDRIRKMLRTITGGTKFERATGSAAYVAAIERLARVDRRVVVMPEDLDADPYILNTQSGLVDLRTGIIRPHESVTLVTRITGAAIDPTQGRDLWHRFLSDITQGDTALSDYLQRLIGYCAIGATDEDILAYLFGIGSNGKSSFIEACGDSLGDYAMVFSPEVLMEAKGERHPTELAQFMGVRMAISSEPSSSATWNDSRVKAMTGDATISARYMRGDNFTFKRTHKTIIIGNHMPRLNAVTHAIRRRIQMVPFRAVFTPTAGPEMRERLKTEALGAILSWVVSGAVAWRSHGTKPPAAVRALTDDYLANEDQLGQWIEERCDRVDASRSERSSDLHRNYADWVTSNGGKPKGSKSFSSDLLSAGFRRGHTMVGTVFYGIELKRQ